MGKTEERLQGEVSRRRKKTDVKAWKKKRKEKLDKRRSNIEDLERNAEEIRGDCGRGEVSRGHERGGNRDGRRKGDDRRSLEGWRDVVWGSTERTDAVLLKQS